MSTITAYDFAQTQGGSYRFGTGDAASALRTLADRIDARDVIVEKVHVSTIARSDEFTETVLVLRFEERAQL